MKEYLSLREIQLEEYSMLVCLANFLDEHHINYILAGGTMLGAVRHNGFIPWDDDIDILIFREDYERFKKIIKKDLYIGAYRVSCPGQDKHIYPFIKLINDTLKIEEENRDNRTNELDQCLWIDIFPLDHYPDSEKTHRRYLKRIRFLMRLLSVGTLSESYFQKKGWNSTYRKKIILHLSLWLYRLLGGYRRLSLLIDEYAKRMNQKYCNSNHVGDGTWPNGMNDYFEIDMVTPTIKHLFEKGYFNIPQNYDGYLSSFYGDYMTLPPEEKRGGHHISVYREV